MAVAVHNKTSSWLEENEKFFLPPVCNKMMHNDQLKVALADLEMSYMCTLYTCKTVFKLALYMIRVV